MGFGNFFSKVREKFRQFGAFLPKIGKKLTVAIEAGDVDKVNGHLDEFDEMLMQGRVMSAYLREAVADGELTPTESAVALVKLKTFLESAKDVVTGDDD